MTRVDRSRVQSLVSHDLQNRRPFRYRGDDQAVPLAAFTVEEQTCLDVLYAFLREVCDAALKGTDALDRLLADHDIESLMKRMATLGRGRSIRSSVTMAAHDLRGGVISALLLELGARPAQRLDPATLASMAKDCLKQMRNLLADIDPPARAVDQQLRYHSLRDLVSALAHYQGSSRAGRTQLTIDADRDGTIAASCTEYGTVERIVFNLLENASRHAPDHEVQAFLLTMGENLRVAVANGIDADHQASLRTLLAEGPAHLYSTYTTTDSGYGLQITADLVGRAYGIDAIDELVAGGYVGTTLAEGAFVSWFHWPLARAVPDNCDCR